jgi:hypothetical protein
MALSNPGARGVLKVFETTILASHGAAIYEERIREVDEPHAPSMSLPK